MTNSRQSSRIALIIYQQVLHLDIFIFGSNWKFKLATMFWTKRRGAGIWPKGPKDKRRRTMTNARQSCRVALFAGYAPDCYPSACSRGGGNGGDTHKATRRIERIYIYFFLFILLAILCREWQEWNVVWNVVMELRSEHYIGREEIFYQLGKWRIKINCIKNITLSWNRDNDLRLVELIWYYETGD